MDLKKETYEINKDLFRLRGKHNGVNIGDGEINLLAHIVRLHINNLSANKKDYCDASNAHFRDYLYLPETESGLNTVKDRLKKLRTAGFINTDGKTNNRKIFVQFNYLNNTINSVVNNEAPIEEKKANSKKASTERAAKSGFEPNKIDYVKRLKEQYPKDKKKIGDCFKKYTAKGLDKDKLARLWYFNSQNDGLWGGFYSAYENLTGEKHPKDSR